MPTKTISHNELKDLNFVEKSGILQTSVEYLIVKICENYCEVKNIGSIKDFNRENNISIIKAVVFPFFISTSNGHYEALYSLFGKFRYSENFGFISGRVLSELLVSTILKIETKTKITSEESDFHKLSNDILQKKFTIYGDVIPFKDIKIYKDNKEMNELHHAIDSGINTLLRITSLNFFNYSEAELRESSNKYIAYLRGEEPDFNSINEIRKNIYYSEKV